MTDFEQILPLWQELEASGADYVLATVVAVEGSSYRKPGARMLLSADGRRGGTVSGGCLEAAVAKKAWWLTNDGPMLERYSTYEDDGDLPYGSGCGGVVHILLERSTTAAPLLKQMKSAFDNRTALAIATILDGPHRGQRAFAGSRTDMSDAGEESTGRHAFSIELEMLAREGIERELSFESTLSIDGGRSRVGVDYRPARPGLWIFGAGDDARPLVNLARELGWFVAVADGRFPLATHARFPRADEVHALLISELPGAAATSLTLRPRDAAVLLTHSFEQDARVLAWLLGSGRPLAYIGVLGPQRRTRELLAETARLIGLTPSPERVERWLAGLNAPTGLDLGAETPATVALSILAEVQKVLTAGTALPLREVRATQGVATHA